MDGFGFSISLYSLDFHYLILVIISMYSFGFGELDIGLEQPIANWAKLGKKLWSLEEDLCSQLDVIARYARTGEPPAYIERSTPRG